MARILVIDDDRLVRATIQHMLKRGGYTVEVAECGRDAVAAVEATPFDAVLVDLIMPGLDGLDTIKIIHDRAPDASIIAMSGYKFRGGATEMDFFPLAISAGAVSCLQKPFRFEELINAIETGRAAPGAVQRIKLSKQA